MTMNEPTEPIEMLKVSNEHVELEEKLSKKDEGWVISFSLTSLADSPVAVKISVPMPEGDGPLDTGFHPKHEPHNWDLRDGVLTFEDTVPEDEPLLVLLGIVMAGDERTSLALTEPTIETSQPLDPADAVSPITAESPIFRSSSIDAKQEFGFGETGPSGDEPAVGVESDEIGVSTADEGADSAAEAPTDDIGSPPEPDRTPATDSAGWPAEERESNERGLEWLTDRSSGDQAADKVQDTSDPGQGSTGVDTVEAETDAPDDDQAASSPASESRAGTGGMSESSASATESTDSIDVLSVLIEQLESSDPDDESVEALREQLEFGAPKSVDVRLEHIQSRMDNLAAYTEALEGFIDEHGTASEFVDEIHSELEQLRSAVDDIDDNASEAAAARKDLRSRLSEMESTVEETNQDLRSRIDNIYDDLDAIRETVNQRGDTIESLEASVETHDAAIDSLDARFDSVEADLMDRLDDIAENLSSFDNRLTARQEAIDDRLGELSERVDEYRQSYDAELSDLSEEVDHLSEMRDIFSKAFAREQPGEEPEAGLEADEKAESDEDDSE